MAADPRIDALRNKIDCVEDPAFTADYHDPEKRSIANGLTVQFKDGGTLDEVVCEYPIGHRLRRKEGIPLLEDKFRRNLARRFPARQQQRILDASLNRKALETMPVHEYVDRSEEHTSELQSLMRISYAVFCLKKKKNKTSSRS